MSSISLGSIMDSIQGYRRIFEQFSYKETGTGTRPWSARYEDAHGNVIDFNSHGWDLFMGENFYSGRNHKELKAKLLSDCTKEQLIKMLTD